LDREHALNYLHPVVPSLKESRHTPSRRVGVPLARLAELRHPERRLARIDHLNALRLEQHRLSGIIEQSVRVALDAEYLVLTTDRQRPEMPTVGGDRVTQQHFHVWVPED
jgi:hypothetical protein